MPEAVPADWELPGDLLGESSGGFADAVRRDGDHLVYFLLNVGDGDTQLLLLPADEQGRRRAVVVDIATVDKLPALVEALRGAGILAGPGRPVTFPIMVGTHPHDDHIGGVSDFLDRYGQEVSEYWEPGYYHTSDTFIETMVALEDRPWIQRTQPTSGMTRYMGGVRLAVLAPGIGLRSRFDSYGVEINDASIALRVDFPATRVASAPSDDGHHDRVYLRLDDPWSLILGADAQTTSWAQATLDFPRLHREHNPVLYRELRLGMGHDPLRAQIFKVPHHASKHGVNLELVERMQPRLALVSCSGGGRYGFPHHLALEAVREAIEPTATSGGERPPDHVLGIHYTCASGVSDGVAVPLGSCAVIVPPGRGAALALWRFFDGRGDQIDLQRGRPMRRVSGAVDPQAAAGPPRRP